MKGRKGTHHWHSQDSSDKVYPITITGTFCTGRRKTAVITAQDCGMDLWMPLPTIFVPVSQLFGSTLDSIVQART